MVDSATARRLFNQHKTMVYRICLRIGSGEADAEDLMQDVFLRVFSSYRQLQVPAQEEAWVRTIAINVLRSKIKVAGSIRRFLKRLASIWSSSDDEPNSLDRDDVFPVSEPLLPADQQALSVAQQELLKEAYGSLPQERRELLWMRDVEGCSEEECATNFGLEIGELRKKNYRARQEVAFRFLALLLQDETDRTPETEHGCVYDRFISHHKAATAVEGASGRYVRQNAAHRNLLGYNDAELSEKSPASVFGPDVTANVEKSIRRSKTGQYEGQLSFQTRSGASLKLNTHVITVPARGSGTLCRLWRHWSIDGEQGTMKRKKDSHGHSCAATRQAVSDAIQSAAHRALPAHIEAHLHTCEACRNASEWMQRTVEALKHLDDDVDSPARIEEKIFKRFEAEQRPRMPRVWFVLAPAASLIALTLVFLGHRPPVRRELPDPQRGLKVSPRPSSQFKITVRLRGSDGDSQIIPPGGVLHSAGSYSVEVDVVGPVFLYIAERTLSPWQAVVWRYPMNAEPPVVEKGLRIPKEGIFHLDETANGAEVVVIASESPLSQKERDQHTEGSGVFAHAHDGGPVSLACPFMNDGPGISACWEHGVAIVRYNVRRGIKEGSR